MPDRNADILVGTFELKRATNNPPRADRLVTSNPPREDRLVTSNGGRVKTNGKRGSSVVLLFEVSAYSGNYK